MVLSQLFISYKQNHSIFLWRPTFNLKSGVLASATWPRERHDMRSMYIVALMTSGKRSWPQERLVLKLSIDCDCSTMHDEKAKKIGEIIFSVTQNLTCELPQFLRDFGDFACKLKNYIILLQFVIWLNVL